MTRYFIFIYLFTCACACEESQEPTYIDIDGQPDYITRLGIPVYTDGLHDPDLEYTDQVYLDVCDCVGVDPEDYIGDFHIHIIEDVQYAGHSVGGVYFYPSDEIWARYDQWSLAHELGHFFMETLIGYSAIGYQYHLPDHYDQVCGYY